MQANQIGSLSPDSIISNSSDVNTKPEKLTLAEQLRVLKGNFNFLVVNFLGLTSMGYRDEKSGEYRLAVDKIYAICNMRNNLMVDENCPIECAVQKAQTKVHTQEGMEHAKILGVSSAHVWNRAKKLRSERKELNGELESILTDGEACFSHSYMSAILSAFPTQQDSVQNETILDIFDSELEKIKKMEVEGENSTLHICTIRDSIRRITTKLPDGVRSKFPVFARGK